jgi:hypothetical protein
VVAAGRGRGGVGVRRCLDGEWRRRTGAGRPGTAGGAGGGAAARGRRGGRRPEVGGDPDKRAPLVCERGRGGREEVERAGLGQNRDGPRGG